MKTLLKVALKRMAFIVSGFMALLLLTVLVIAVTFFFNPTIFINPKNLDYALKKTSVLKSWKWKSAEINHQWLSWDRRRFFGGFEDLCLVYDNADVNVDTCMEKVSWNVELMWNMKEGFHYKIYNPLVINSSKLIISPKDNPIESPPPDILSYWETIWSSITPDMEVNLRKIEILKKDKPLVFDLKLIKKGKSLEAYALGFNLVASKNKISINAPKKILLPFDLKTKNPLYFNEIKIEARIGKNTIPITATAKLESAKLTLGSSISTASLKEDLSKPKFLQDLLLQTKASLEVAEIKSTVANLVRAPYNILPAPLNAMEGTLKINVVTAKDKDPNGILFKITSAIDMSGNKQELKLAIMSDVPYVLTSKEVGAIVLGLSLEKVRLLLPKLARNKLPPQLIPDSRFKNSQIIVKENLNEQNLPPKVKASPIKKDVEVDVRLQAIGEHALFINTNLLDQALGLNFDLEIKNGEIEKGYIQTLPLTTTIFKRKLVIPSVRIIFNFPLEPEIKAVIEFHLPEYTITLNLEGPMSKPRQAFSSSPPLPVDDIYAVLLFGRPLSALDSDDKTAAQKTNQLVSQGILSLAVLYYFAGSPIESVGYDPESNEVSAQIGLGKRNSLHVGGSGSGVNSAGVRHSLGKGWYIDSSVQKTTDQNGTKGGDYGVLLERIISY